MFRTGQRVICGRGQLCEVMAVAEDGRLTLYGLESIAHEPPGNVRSHVAPWDVHLALGQR